MPSTAFSLLPVCLRPCRGVPGDYTAQEGAVAAYTHQPDALFIKQVERVSVTLPPPPRRTSSLALPLALQYLGA